MTHTQTDRRTWRLYDQLGPEGRVGEKLITRFLHQSLICVLFNDSEFVYIENKLFFLKHFMLPT